MNFENYMHSCMHVGIYYAIVAHALLKCVRMYRVGGVGCIGVSVRVDIRVCG